MFAFHTTFRRLRLADTALLVSAMAVGSHVAWHFRSPCLLRQRRKRRAGLVDNSTTISRPTQRKSYAQRRRVDSRTRQPRLEVPQSDGRSKWQRDAAQRYDICGWCKRHASCSRSWSMVGFIGLTCLQLVYIYIYIYICIYILIAYTFENGLGNAANAADIN